LTKCTLINSCTRSHLATEENVQEAVRLFTVSTMDAAKSGINQQINLTPDMANEIKVCIVTRAILLFPSCFISWCIGLHCEQQAETQIKRRIGIGNHISERRLIDDLGRMGMNESIVSIKCPLKLKDGIIYINLNFMSSLGSKY